MIWLMLKGSRLPEKTSSDRTGEIKNKSLFYSKMNSSNLICDCQLSWLPRWLRDKGFESMVYLRCAHPEFLTNHSIFEVQRNEFECGKYMI